MYFTYMLDKNTAKAMGEENDWPPFNLIKEARTVIYAGGEG
jgi:hypothetical protein